MRLRVGVTHPLSKWKMKSEEIMNYKLEKKPFVWLNLKHEMNSMNISNIMFSLELQIRYISRTILE
jgi:hypothetical protein